MRIILIRHGEADYDRDCLTDTGRKQACAAAERLRRIRLSAIFSSPCGRALETAAPTAAIHGLPVQTLEFLREIDMSDLREEEPWALAKRIAAEENVLFTSDSWKKHPAFSENVSTQSFERVAESMDLFLEQQGYCRDGNRYKRTAKDPEKNIALFCHIGSGCSILSSVLKIPFPRVCGTLQLSNAGVTILRFEEDTGGYAVPVLETLNDTGFLYRAAE